MQNRERILHTEHIREVQKFLKRNFSLKAFNFFYVCIDVCVVIFRYFITTYLRYRASKQMFE